MENLYLDERRIVKLNLIMNEHQQQEYNRKLAAYIEASSQFSANYFPCTRCLNVKYSLNTTTN
jgi:isocitrate dehydrogenase kinase/phosphatase